MLLTLWDAGMPGLQWGIVFGASLAGAVWDLSTRRIPNVLTMPVFLAGVLWACYAGGVSGLVDSLVGCALLALPYILLFLFAGGGAGDAKVMGAIGAWLGTVNGLFALAAVSLAGVALAVVFAIKRRKASALIAKLAAFACWTVGLAAGRGASSAKEDLKDMEALGKMPYGLAIVVGVWLAGAGILVYRW